MLFIAMLFEPASQSMYSDGWNKKSTLTIDHAVEIPGMVLQPGTYIFKLEESSSKRNLVHVLTADGTSIVAKLIAVPDFRAREGFGDEVFTYHKSGADRPRVMQSWYYPGDLNGLEFVYSRDRAKQIAKSADCNVIASKNKDVSESAIVAVTPTGIEVVIDDAPKVEIVRQKPRPK
jgi:hypothetical protein